MNMFRTLRADEIDCRISQIKSDDGGNASGLSLLLYKDARCDQNILDETVTPFGWKREHSRDNANCTVSIWDDKKQQWISKEDTGTQSYTEKEKGLASDSFKRACFNWGIGRELYTAPFIWVKAADCNIRQYKGKWSCYDNFTVAGISYTDGVITGLQIKNQKTGKICFRYGKVKADEKAPDKPEQPDNEPEPVPERVPPTAKVSTGGKLPEVTPAQAYLNREQAAMSQILGISDRNLMKQKFAAMRQELIEGGVIPDVKSDKLTMEQAQQMIQAMYKDFIPGGYTDARTA